jgi:hypothetical protein
VPRFDLLDRRKYLSMAVQFSRGCPFQCEFCDIITIYGRKPRMKSPDQVIAECEALRRLGWRGRVFVVDDNFIGNHKQALTLAERMAEWQHEHGYPISFTTEASMDLALHPRLIEAMVRANFWSVFMGIESPSRESLTQIKKFQNLRQDPLECIRTVQRGGLWVTGGFIVGFDADTEDIFERQVDFIERAAIVCAMTGFLEALPTTPLYERLAREGRLLDDAKPKGQFKPPNFKTRMPLRTMIAGNRQILGTIYAPATYFDRALRSLEDWTASEHHHFPRINVVTVLGRSLIKQGLLSSYRGDYWKFLFTMMRRWIGQPKKFPAALRADARDWQRPSQPHALAPEGLDEVAGQRLQPERVNRLPTARRREVERCADIRMMDVQVDDLERPEAHRRQQQPAEDAIQPLAPMNQLVRDVDGKHRAFRDRVEPERTPIAASTSGRTSSPPRCSMMDGSRQAIGCPSSVKRSSASSS